MNNSELPLGLTFELVKHPDELNRFSQMTETERQSLVEQARNVKTREEMKALVESIK